MSTDRIRQLGALAIFVAALDSSSLAADDPVPVPGIPIEEVAVGMHGYGLSVFAGTQPERFEVEVLGGPGHEHYRVRWDDDRETVFYPSSDATIRRHEPVQDKAKATRSR